MGSLLQMVPGMGKAMQGFDEEAGERELRHIEAMILSMTPAERKDYTIINGSRRKRIADGSGTTVQDVNRLLKQFDETRRMMQMMTDKNNARKMMGRMPKKH